MIHLSGQYELKSKPLCFTNLSIHEYRPTKTVNEKIVSQTVFYNFSVDNVNNYFIIY